MIFLEARRVCGLVATVASIYAEFIVCQEPAKHDIELLAFDISISPLTGGETEAGGV